MIGPSDPIDIIIPARGSVPWLTPALQSVCEQTYGTISVTVVDDGLESPDAVRHLGAQLFGPRFELLKNPARGISSALNAGVQNSRAAWIARMDADDIAHPRRIEQQLKFLASRGDGVIACGTQVRFINGLGKILGESGLPTDWPQINVEIYSRTCFVHSSMVFRREALVETPYRPCMDGAEDVDLILRLAERGQVLNLSEPLLDYRLHPSQESFRDRARATAIQELAFRLAFTRRHTARDPVDQCGELAEQFIHWRLSDPAYVRARIFLTALRYCKTYLMGRDIRGFSRMASTSIRSLPNNWSTLHTCWQVARKAGAALLAQPTPFVELNLP
jgi:glycosyltransferase involved in cell wall biosynthesis